jgi:hypothetical protein
MIKELVQSVYDSTIRDYLPRKIKVYNGVALGIGRLFDTNVVDPDYKQGTIGSLREYCEHDDHVVVIGGGLGVSAVVGAHAADTVTVYEGGIDIAERTRGTAGLNRVEDTITVTEAIVAEDRDVYGENITDTTVSPGEIEDCDVLEMDCEGAEVPILREMEIEPRVIIVESHPPFDAPPKQVRSLLTERGYEIVDRYELESGNVTFTAILDGSSD